MAAPAEVEPDYLLPSHEGPWTVEDVLALPEDSTHRIELVDGALLVSPMGSLRHQLLIGWIHAMLFAAAPKHLETTIEVNVVLPGGRLLIPDFTVLDRSGDLDGVTAAAKDVLLVGEVISPSTRMQDRLLKPGLYAEAEIPYYLLVDPKGGKKEKTPSLVLMELVDGEYKEILRDRDGRLELEFPFSVVLDLSGR
jgi:Uma2 family endonuclease